MTQETPPEEHGYTAHQLKRADISSPIFMFDPMSELTGGAPMGDDRPMPPPQQQFNQGGRSFAQDIHSVTIHARQRTFYIDLKQSGNGRFFKVSEKSRGGQKTTIMFDSEDLDKFIAAFQEMKTKLAGA
jgi:hypothetical protein